MALPDGITTATVIVGVPVTHTGAAVKTYVSIEPSAYLVHAATGTPLVDFLEELSIAEGVAGQFTLPHTDQAGFIDESGNAYTNWYYTARVTYSTPSKAKNKAPKVKVFQLATGQTEVDLDLLPSGAPALPYIAPTANVTSFGGRTGPVTLEESDLPERLTDTALNATYDRAEKPSWASAQHKFDPRRSVYNLSARSLPRWSAAVARAGNGGANAHLMVLGDSISRGAGANTPYTQWAWPSILRNNLVKLLGDPGGLGWNTFNDEASTAADPLMVVTGFTRDGNRGLHQEARTSAANGNTIVYGPINSTKFRIKWAARVGGGQFTWAVNGGATTTVDTAAGAETIQETVITVTAASNTLTITALGANVTILAIEAVVTDNGKVKVTRGARNGARIGNINSTATPTSALALFPTLAPDLTIIALETNDFDSQVAVATYKASVKTVIDAARAVNSDVMLVATIPPDLVETIPLTEYTGALYELADEYDLPLLDMQHRWGSWATSNAAPYLLYSDTLHPSAKGHQDYARAVFDVIAGAWLNAPVVGVDASQTWTAQQQFNAVTKFGTSGNYVQIGNFNVVDQAKQSVTTNGNDLLIRAATGGTIYAMSNFKMDPVTFSPNNSGIIPIRIKAAASQSAALFRTEDSAGVEKFSLDQLGRPYVKSNLPTIAAANGSTATTISGSDPAMTVNFTTANGTAAGATVATITYNTAYAGTPRLALSPLNAASAGAVYVTGKSTTGFSLALVATQAAANAMSFDVQVIGS